jgi:hypothetical protein
VASGQRWGRGRGSPGPRVPASPRPHLILFPLFLDPPLPVLFLFPCERK